MSRLWIAFLIASLPIGAMAQSTFKVGFETGLETPATDVKPVASKPAAATTGTADKGPTVIDSLEGATFDEKTRTAVFTGDVHVVDPQFRLTCDKLTAYLKKENQKPAPGSAAPAAPATTGTNGKAANDPANGLEKAVAEGHVVILQDKVDADGKVNHYIGKGAKAVYESATGDLTLTGWPQVQNGTNTQVATEAGTIMIMNRDGQMRTKGRSHTVITQQPDNKDPKKK